jgi:hydrogenase maturation protein HypF
MPPLAPAAAGLAHAAWRAGIGQVTSSAAGRVFDAAAALILGLGQTSFEGQGPMLLESLAAGQPAADWIELPLAPDAAGVWRCDWAPLLPLLADASRPAGWRAALLHESLARAIAAQAVLLAAQHGFDAVGLVGGVFQNRLLAERAAVLLADAGLCVHLPTIVPGNDGGLAFGQLIEAAAT